MTVDLLLSHLDGIRHTGPGRWLARCPAHNDKRPSLSIREIDGDRVLIHCWAGCSAGEVLDSIGLTFEALYPRCPTHRGTAERRPFPAADILRAVEHEALIVAMVALTLGTGAALSDVDRARLVLASQRLTAAVQESGYA